MQIDLVLKIDDPNLKVYVVWMPILSPDIPRPNKTTLGLVSDPRVTQYWDTKAELSRIFPSILGFPSAPASPAWDVFLLFDRDAEWTALAPPKPVF